MQVNFTEQVANRPDILCKLNRAIQSIDTFTNPQASIQSPIYKACADALHKKNAVLLAHYYVDASLQALAENTGGFVGDSLQMAQFGASSNADEIIVAGVRFMAETAKILAPHKTVRVIHAEAECSLDLACPPDALQSFCQQHPQRQLVVYANTSAKVKAMADWVVTSSIALDVIDHLCAEEQAIIWAPDKHLGHYLQQQTGADMLLWDGACVVHEEFKAEAIRDMKAMFPHAGILAHPESPQSVLRIADAIGSTSQLIAFAKKLAFDEFIIATDSGIFYKMQQAVPHKTLHIAPTAGKGAHCKSCAHCPWMGLNNLHDLYDVLTKNTHAIHIESQTITKAQQPLERMLDFAQKI